jgi:hypothetical protein
MAKLSLILSSGQRVQLGPAHWTAELETQCTWNATASPSKTTSRLSPLRKNIFTLERSDLLTPLKNPMERPPNNIVSHLRRDFGFAGCSRRWISSRIRDRMMAFTETPHVRFQPSSVRTITEGRSRCFSIMRMPAPPSFGASMKSQKRVIVQLIIPELLD